MTSSGGAMRALRDAVRTLRRLCFLVGLAVISMHALATAGAIDFHLCVGPVGYCAGMRPRLVIPAPRRPPRPIEMSSSEPQ